MQLESEKKRKKVEQRKCLKINGQEFLKNNKRYKITDLRSSQNLKQHKYQDKQHPNHKQNKNYENRHFILKLLNTKDRKKSLKVDKKGESTKPEDK